MAYEMKEGDFSLFKNTKKEAENQPDYTGKCHINGKDMRVSAWIKQSDSGLAFFSGKISEFPAKTGNIEDPLNPSGSTPPQHKPEPLPLPDDDLPF
jgi:uncharacterized protein (DUF736 family)